MVRFNGKNENIAEKRNLLSSMNQIDDDSKHVENGRFVCLLKGAS